ncbi:MAG: hypothetical protein ACP5F1_00685 [Thermoplasmata archaeon]|nr:hypothetical protein [Thermoplasmata archaeon]
MKKLLERENNVWKFSFIIVIVSLISSMLVFFISFNLLSEVNPYYTNTYQVTFKEYGLPNNTIWKVSINNLTENSSTDTIVFQVSNGTYNFSIPEIKGLIPVPSNGTIIINSNITINVIFK